MTKADHLIEAYLEDILVIEDGELLLLYCCSHNRRRSSCNRLQDMPTTWRPRKPSTPHWNIW
jgi:hypothetical protein